MHEPNSLIHASSPYLLQHAYNPVEWMEWNKASLEKAKSENKLIIVSVGYSACHWCHVMERESFENFEVAEVMNKHFVCIKVDREERPDIDQIYMLAVQLMNGNGGWPLNAICLPDQRPIYGGTYFQKKDWINILLNLAELWEKEPKKAEAYAARLSEGIDQSEKIDIFSNVETFKKDQLMEIVKPWKRHFDVSEGGYNRAPKFPLPNNWHFLLRYGYLFDDEAVTFETMLTLEKMAFGGIYDQIGGGFARYSVDDKWHVPHFEKMLYDNAQLISLYAEAYQQLKLPMYKTVVFETLDWLEREMTSSEGLFYSALDADSEGVEGKYYIWDLVEFSEILGDDAKLISDYFQVSAVGNWEEEETNILNRKFSDDEFAAMKGINPELLAKKVSVAKEKLLKHRAKRIRPGLDDKCLLAWNALMIKALAESSSVFGSPELYKKAVKATQFILDNMTNGQDGLYRNFKAGKASISAFLDDYAFFIEALIALYQVDFNEFWLMEARKWADFVIDKFVDPSSPMFFYTSSKSEPLISRKHEIMDNVIPASNSAMAQNLKKLGLLFDNSNYLERSRAMLAAILPRMKSYGSAYSNWSIQLLEEVCGINEIAIVGAEYHSIMQDLNNHYVPNKILLGGNEGTLPLLIGKNSDSTKIFVCKDHTCQLPVNNVDEALKLVDR